MADRMVLESSSVNGMSVGGRRVLMIVQNLPVPLDRRVWLECQALTRAATRECDLPIGPGDPTRHEIDGIRIYKYRPAPQAAGVLGYAFEFVYSWLRTAWLSIVVWRDVGFDVIQACNPPDTYWLLAPPVALTGRALRVRPARPESGVVPVAIRCTDDAVRTGPVPVPALARATDLPHGRPRHLDERVVPVEGASVAEDGATTTSRSYAAVRTPQRMRPVYPTPTIRAGADHLLVYLGIMGPQDGVDVVIDVVDELVHRRGRVGLRVALLGFGDCLEELKAQSAASDSTSTWCSRVVSDWMPSPTT